MKILFCSWVVTDALAGKTAFHWAFFKCDYKKSRLVCSTCNYQCSSLRIYNLHCKLHSSIPNYSFRCGIPAVWSYFQHIQVLVHISPGYIMISGKVCALMATVRRCFVHCIFVNTKVITLKIFWAFWKLTWELGLQFCTLSNNVIKLFMCWQVSDPLYLVFIEIGLLPMSTQGLLQTEKGLTRMCSWCQTLSLDNLIAFLSKPALWMMNMEAKCLIPSSTMQSIREELETFIMSILVW